MLRKFIRLILEQQESEFEKARQVVQKIYGPPIAESRHRVVFRDGDEVIKVPTRISGISACEQELREQGELYAKTRLDEELTKKTGLLIVRMEWVEHTGFSKKPDWTWGIDSGQVGLTKDGRLVAYDWEHF